MWEEKFEMRFSRSSINKITLLTSIINRDKQPNKPISFDFLLFLRLRSFVRQICSTSWNSKQKQTDLYINDPGLYPVIYLTSLSSPRGELVCQQCSAILHAETKKYSLIYRLPDRNCIRVIARYNVVELDFADKF